MTSSRELPSPTSTIENEIDALTAYFSKERDSFFTSTTSITSSTNNAIEPSSSTTTNSWFSIPDIIATYIITQLISIICIFLPRIFQPPLLFVTRKVVNSPCIKYAFLFINCCLFLVLFTHILEFFMLIYQLLIVIKALTTGAANAMSCLSSPISCMRSSTPTFFGLRNRKNFFTSNNDNTVDANKADDETWIHIADEEYIFSMWSSALNKSLFTARETSFASSPPNNTANANPQALLSMAALLKNEQTVSNTILAMSRRDTVKDASIKPIIPHFIRVQESMASLVEAYRIFRDDWVHHTQEIERSTLYLTEELVAMVSSGREILNSWTQCTYHHTCASSMTFFRQENKNAESVRIRAIRHKINHLRKDYISMIAAEAQILGDRSAGLLKEADNLSSNVRAVVSSHIKAQSKKSQRLHAIEKERGSTFYKYNDHIFDRGGKKDRDSQNAALKGDLDVLARLEKMAQKLRERVDGDQSVWESVIVECEKFGGEWTIARSDEGRVSGNGNKNKNGEDGNILTKERSEEVKGFFDLVEKWAEQRLSFVNLLSKNGMDL